jgi:hypothetical protein
MLVRLLAASLLFVWQLHVLFQLVPAGNSRFGCMPFPYLHVLVG